MEMSGVKNRRGKRKMAGTERVVRRRDKGRRKDGGQRIGTQKRMTGTGHAGRHGWCEDVEIGPRAMAVARFAPVASSKWEMCTIFPLN